MNLTPYEAKYFAHELTRRCASDSAEKLAGAVASAQVDLNPHQVDAALFAFNSPLAKGVLLADEVGLGKTIEAGLVLSQKRAETPFAFPRPLARFGLIHDHLKYPALIGLVRSKILRRAHHSDGNRFELIYVQHGGIAAG
jgi:hypothetical protein